MDASDPSAAPIRWARVLAGAVLVLLLVEAIAQGAVYAFAGRPFESLSLYRWSPYGLVRNNPALTSPGFQINRNGFRDVRDFEKRKGERVFRVMLLGGSVLYSGLGGRAVIAQDGRVRSDQTIAQYLAERLRADPDFGGAEIEVINTAVNFNRIVEVSTAYLGEYIDWRPDALVVFGAVNNFAGTRLQGDMARSATPLQRPHPWHREFDRLNNDASLAATLEGIWRSGNEHSAALALAYKVVAGLADRAASLSRVVALGRKVPATGAMETVDEREAYFQYFAAYADAMTAAARRSGQAIAFAWEPRLVDVASIKPLTVEERTILQALREPPEVARQYEAIRKRFADYFAGEGVPVMDPTEPLRQHAGRVYIDYAHYTAEGNEFVAGVLHAQLKPLLLAQFRKRFGGR